MSETGIVNTRTNTVLSRDNSYGPSLPRKKKYTHFLKRTSSVTIKRILFKVTVQSGCVVVSHLEVPCPDSVYCRVKGLQSSINVLWYCCKDLWTDTSTFCWSFLLSHRRSRHGTPVPRQQRRMKILYVGRLVHSLRLGQELILRSTKGPTF